MPALDYRALRREIGIAAVLDLLHFVPQKRRGDQLGGRCPLHRARCAGHAFSANLRRNAYRCFQCGSCGNQLDLWAAATQQPLYQAAIDLCAKLNQPVPWLPQRTRQTKFRPAT
jgi:DNA primase